MRIGLSCSAALAITAGMMSSTGPLAVAQAAAAQVAPAGAARMLYIDVLEGEGELNDIRARTAREPVVQVKDENHKPVAGALVLFAIQSGGGAQPVAAFSGLSTLTVRTGADGVARAQNYKTGRPGNVQILVTATVGAITATALIHQTNYGPSGHFEQTMATHKAALGVGAAVLASLTFCVVETATPQGGAVISLGPGGVQLIRRTPNPKQ